MFSWNKKPSDEPTPSDGVGKENKNSMESSSTEKKETFSGFDPTGLERAAKAARELGDLKYADEAIKISKEQEVTKQREAQVKIEENKTRQKAFEAERVRMQEEERRRTIEAEKQAAQQNAYYQDQLARKRNQDEIQAQRAIRDENLKRQEESQMRIEALRRQTAEYEANIRKETDQARVEAETKGRIEQERKNWDLHMQRSKMESIEFRSTVLEGIREAGSILGDGFKEYISDTQKLTTTVGVLTAIAVGIYSAKVSTGVAGRFIEARLGKPPLVRDTSRKGLLKTVTSPVQTFRNLFGKRTGAMDGLVMESTLRDRLQALAVSTANTNKNNAPYRNMMLYGPPGTGKTMFARNLAQSTGMDYAIMTGGDVAPLGRDGVTEIHKLFDWSQTSRKGLLLFIDEADAFLRKRTNETLSEDLRNSLNAFLYRTGTESKQCMIVYATNQPDQLDWAINDRTDELIEFGLPGESEREQMIKQYFNMYVEESHNLQSGMFGGPKQIKVEGVSDELFAEYAKQTEGFSGREISKMAIAWQAAARATPECNITKEMMQQVRAR